MLRSAIQQIYRLSVSQKWELKQLETEENLVENEYLNVKVEST